MSVKYAHTNIVARDWKKLAQFYIDVFGCEPVYPERDHYGEWLDRLTGMENIRLQGMHLRLPGHEDGPTLEIYQFNMFEEKGVPAVNSPGFGHIAFLVNDVGHYLENLLKNGGGKLGEKVEKEVEGVGVLTVVYATDPEGNIVEIQSWD